MKRRMIMNITTIILSFMLLVTVSFAWWIGGDASRKVIIRTANIAAEVKTYNCNDFNRDGVLDKLNPFDLNALEDAQKGETGGKPVNVKLKLKDIAPGEVFSFKVVVKNEGDASGYVNATLNEDFDLQKNSLYIKFFSISACLITKDNSGNETILYDKMTRTYINNILKDPTLNKDTIPTVTLFGADKSAFVKVGESSQYLLQLELVPFDELVKNNVVTNDIATLAEYNELQGLGQTKPVPPAQSPAPFSFSFIDISLQSEIGHQINL